MSGQKRVVVFVALVVLGALVMFLLDGCALAKGRIKGAGVTVQGAKDANGVSLDTVASVASLPIPAGSKLTTTKWEPVQYRPAINGRPEIAAQPAREVTEVVLSRDAVWRKDETKIVADTGVIDTSVATRRIQAAENRYLLFAAIGAAVAGGFFLYIKYPTPALMCGAASVVFFLCWRLAGLPDYFWAIGAVAIVGGVFLYLGHNRGERDGVKAAVSGNLESPTPKIVP